MASNSLGLRGRYKRKYFSWNWKLYNVLFRVYLHLHSTIPHNRKKQFLWQMLIRQFSKAFTGFHSFLALWMTCVGEPGSFNKVTYVNNFQSITTPPSVYRWIPRPRLTLLNHSDRNLSTNVCNTQVNDFYLRFWVHYWFYFK